MNATLTSNNTTTSDSIVNDTFGFVSSVTMTTIAIIGNTAVILILSKKEFRKEPLFRYLFVCTIFDILNVCLIWPSLFQNQLRISKLIWACLSYYYFNTVIGVFISWIQALVTLDTLILVKYPKSQFRKNYKYQIFILLIIFFASCLASMPYIFYLDVKNGWCTGLSILVSFYLNFYFTIISIIIPFILIFGGSLATFLHLRKTQLNINKKNYKKSKRFFKLTLGLNLFFFICLFIPLFVSIIFNATNTLMPNLLYYLFFLLQAFYFSCDFFIYLVVNRKFREVCTAFFNRIKMSLTFKQR